MERVDIPRGVATRLAAIKSRTREILDISPGLAEGIPENAFAVAIPLDDPEGIFFALAEADRSPGPIVYIIAENGEPIEFHSGEERVVLPPRELALNDA